MQESSPSVGIHEGLPSRVSSKQGLEWMLDHEVGMTGHDEEAKQSHPQVTQYRIPLALQPHEPQNPVQAKVRDIVTLDSATKLK